MIRPVRDPSRITSPFGNRKDPSGKTDKQVFHDGIDFSSDSGSKEVLACTDGLVVLDFDGYRDVARWIDPHMSGGNYIIVQHVIGGLKRYIKYLHLVENTVCNGQRIAEGFVLGIYGDVGYSFGAHVHISMYDKLWRLEDPSEFFS